MVDMHIKQVSFSYQNGLIVDNVDLSFASGEAVGILGPNSSGKTTLIKLVSGILQPDKGQVILNGTSLRRLSRKAIARIISVVPQQFTLSFSYTAAQVVMLGRIPFMKAFIEERELDQKLVTEIFQLLGISRLADRHFDELSGGERQKVILAKALAQQPELLLLDEPTTHLDIAYQVEILEQVKILNREHGLTVIAVMHDLNLASLYFNRLILLKSGKVCADGAPQQVLTEAKIREAFSAKVKINRHPVTGSPHILILPQENKFDQAES